MRLRHNVRLYHAPFPASAACSADVCLSLVFLLFWVEVLGTRLGGGVGLDNVVFIVTIAVERGYVLLLLIPPYLVSMLFQVVRGGQPPPGPGERLARVFPSGVTILSGCGLGVEVFGARGEVYYIELRVRVHGVGLGLATVAEIGVVHVRVQATMGRDLGPALIGGVVLDRH